MQQNFEQALACTLREEGGFTSDPRDKGGPTNLGVTQRVWETYLGAKVDEAAMRALTIDDVRPLYRRFYWDKIAGDALPTGLDLALFDFAVNSGPNRACRTLQQILNVTADGVIGPITLAALRGPRHCEERSDEAIQTKIPKESGLPRRLFEPPRNDEKTCTQTPPVIARSEATRQSMESSDESRDVQTGSSNRLAMMKPSRSAPHDPTDACEGGAQTPPVIARSEATRQSMESSDERRDVQIGSSNRLAMMKPKSAPHDPTDACEGGAPNISTLIEKLYIARLDFLRSLPAFATFGKGWTARVNRVAEMAARIVEMSCAPGS